MAFPPLVWKVQNARSEFNDQFCGISLIDRARGSTRAGHLPSNSSVSNLAFRSLPWIRSPSPTEHKWRSTLETTKNTRRNWEITRRRSRTTWLDSTIWDSSEDPAEVSAFSLFFPRARIFCAVYFESGHFETGIAYLNLGHGASSCGAGCPQVALAVFWNNIIEKIWLWEYLNRALCMINSLSVLRFGDTLQRCIFNFSFGYFTPLVFLLAKNTSRFPESLESKIFSLAFKA